MTESALPSAADGFPRRYGEILLARAAPLFEQAALAARQAGLNAVVHTAGSPPELCLEVSAVEHGHASHYRIAADTSRGQVRHQLYFVTDGTTRTLEAGLDSINSMVLDTQLATLFHDGFALTLPAVAERHPAGFW
ncbi:hypothetical protein [Pseudomonas sp. MYb185]|uniref:hypothetical protein n=1 Tax=Pseudomonas sp. MYb185 TaxID=1848729 RepID=UPI000CFB6585|nr:hypothetical protein [Pseudomonas sp. MYb185]PRB80470.1 hypothetical protein CQ007_12135 [Pseudomonas sp. MYb185]